MVVAGYILSPKLCSTNGFWGFECTCIGYETGTEYSLDSKSVLYNLNITLPPYNENMGDTMSLCYGFASERYIRE